MYIRKHAYIYIYMYFRKHAYMCIFGNTHIYIYAYSSIIQIPETEMLKSTAGLSMAQMGASTKSHFITAQIRGSGVYSIYAQRGSGAPCIWRRGRSTNPTS